MHSLSFVLQSLIALYMVLLEGFHFKRRWDDLNRTAPSDPTARPRFYRFYLGLEWSIVAAIAVAALVGQIPLADLGLAAPVWAAGTLPVLLPALVAGAVGGLILPVLLARWVPKLRTSLEQGLDALGQMLPITRSERWTWAACATTAGITEEIRFRGFLTLYLATLLPVLAPLTVVIIAAVLFGLAHWYQGWKGVLGTGLVGFFLGMLAMWTHSLYPGIVLHALMDLRLLGMLWAVGRPAAR